MALTSEDLDKIRILFNEGFETLMLPRFDALELDVRIIKKHVAVLKEDVSVLKADVSTLKTEVREVKTDIRQIKEHLGSLDGRVEALENDIRELYVMMKKDNTNSTFSKISLEKKLLRLNTELLQTAKQAGVTLPR